MLQDGLPPAPQAVGQLLFALRRTGAADVAVPSCGMCRRELPSVRGWTWRCERCRTPRRLCAGCGQLRKPTARDENGHWKCTRCRPVTEPDWDALLIAVHRVAPEASRDLVQRAARQAAPRLAQRRALAAAVIDNPQLLSGRGAESLAKSVFRFIDLLSTRV